MRKWPSRMLRRMSRKRRRLKQMLRPKSKLRSRKRRKRRTRLKGKMRSSNMRKHITQLRNLSLLRSQSQRKPSSPDAPRSAPRRSPVPKIVKRKRLSMRSIGLSNA